MTSIAVYCLFLLSGAAGLVYQVVWVRMFGDVLGNTVYSASAVAGVFLLGLGLGGFVAGRWSDRQHGSDLRRPLLFYGLFELGIAGLALVIAWVLPSLEGLSAYVSSYVTGREGWYELSFTSHLLRGSLAFVLLTPITFLMGGTLTLLIRYLVASDLSRTGWRVGVLYGVNTAGAALGAFTTDLVLIPSLGIFGTEMLAVAVNLVAGAGALILARRLPRSPGPEFGGGAGHAEAWGAKGARHAVAYTGLALFLSGFAAMGIETQ